MTVHPPGQRLAATSSSCTTRTVLTRCPVLLVGLAIAAVTLFATIASALVPELGPGRAPRPTLHGTPTEALTIFLTNGQTLIAPFILAAGRWHTGRVTRHVGDLVVVALVTANATMIGLALGRYPTQLPGYLPHLPLEDGAVAIAAGAWVARRAPACRPAPSLARTAALTAAVTIAAAIVETYAVPHKS